MFHKKKFTLVDEKEEKKMYSARYNHKWVKYVVLLALITFISIMILANVKSQSYYQEKKVSENPAHKIRSITSARAQDCSIKTCAVTCIGDMTNLNKYLQSLGGCSSYTLRISEATFPDDRLSSNWLQGNFVLSLIVIKTSTLREIADGAFNHNAAAKITELELNAVQLESLTENTFIGLKAIKTFTLINKITKFSGDAFLKPMEKTLEKIVIKHVTSIPTDPAPWLRGGGFQRLITIVFDGSNLGGYVNADTFQHAGGVQIIMLNSCKITHIADGTFDFIMNKIFFLLSLQNNQLKRLSGEYLKKVGSLRGVDLLNNPWDCTCELEELIGEFKRYPDGFNNKTECQSPPKFAGKRMDTVDVERCEDTTTVVVNTPSPATMAPTPSSSTKDPDPLKTPSTTEPPKRSSESTPPPIATEPDPKPTPSHVTSPSTLPPSTTEPPTSTYGSSSDSNPTTGSPERPTTATPKNTSTPGPTTTEPTPPSIATEPDPKPTPSHVTSPSTLPPSTTEPPTSTYGSSSDSNPTTGSPERPTTATPKNTSTPGPTTTEPTSPSIATEPDPKPTPSHVTSPSTLPPSTTEPPTSTYGSSSDSNPTTGSPERPTTATPKNTSTPGPTTTEPTSPSIATKPDPKPTPSHVTSPSTLPPSTTEPPTSTYGSSSDSNPTTGSPERPTTATPKNTSTPDAATATTPITTVNDDGGTIPPPQTTPSPQNRTTTLSEDTIFVECQRYTVEPPKSVNEPEFFVELSRPDTHFGITSLSPTSAQLEIDNPSDDLTLIWFYDQPSITGSGENTRIVGEFKMGCQSVLENLVIIEGLVQKRAYTFCLVRVGIQVISPFNCLSFFSNAEGIGLVDESDVWLKREDQALTIGLLSVGCIISICLGIVGMYMLLRLKPSLLKGSKRVIVVNRSTGDVLILPKPCTIKSSMTDSEFCYKNTFGANTTVRQRRFSETSIQSGLSYMVANNYEDIEYRWKMNVVNDMIYANRVPKSPAPPLPKRVSQDKTGDKMKVSVILPKGNDYGYIA